MGLPGISPGETPDAARVAGTTATERPVRDLTTGGLVRTLLLLTFPATVDRLVTNAGGLIQAFWLGRVSEAALPAVVMGTSLRIVLISPMMGLSVGGMAVVARHLGAQERDLADRAVAQALLLVALFTLPLAVLGLLFGPVFLGWMGAEGEVLAEAEDFVRIMMIGLFFMEALPTMNGVIGGAGHPEYTLRNNAVNIVGQLVLTPVLALGMGPIPEMGVAGAGWAAVLAAVAGVGSQMVLLLRGDAGVRLRARHLRPDPQMLGRILRIALPTGTQRLSPNLANALLLRLVAAFGNDVLAAWSLISRLLAFLHSPAIALSATAATLAGHNLGAGAPDRAEKAAKMGTQWGTMASTGLVGLLAVFSGPLLGLFDPTAPVLEICRTVAWFMIPAGAGYAWSTVMSGILAAAGDAVAAMVINVVAMWAVQLPLAWVLSQRTGMGPIGIWLGMVASFGVAALAAEWRFRMGLWRRTAV